MQLKKETEVPAGGAATEHTETEFHIDDALADILGSLQAIDTQEPILTRVIDHACSSEHCMSYRLVAMLRLARWKISADLCNDQPLDACGYIAADAVCRLRDAALSGANSWHEIQLPDYERFECISRGNKVLCKKGDRRILDADEVNRLVRHYSHLDLRHDAAEEWCAGAVALDHFLAGLPNVVEEITTTSPHSQHRWQAWAVNTQTSRQLGSHWWSWAHRRSSYRALQNIVRAPQAHAPPAQPTNCHRAVFNIGCLLLAYSPLAQPKQPTSCSRSLVNIRSSPRAHGPLTQPTSCYRALVNMGCPLSARSLFEQLII